MKNIPNYEPRVSSFTRFLFSLVTLFIMLGALPVGVYLVGQRTQFLPEAAEPAPDVLGEVSITVEKNQELSTSESLAVNVLARSDKESANLFAARVNFPADMLEVEKIATSSADLPDGKIPDNGVITKFIADKWLQNSVENGQVTLIGGVANPGIQTSPNTKYILAVVYFKQKNSGPVTFHLDPDSTIFRNGDNATVNTRHNDTTFDVVGFPQPLQTPSPTNRAQPILSLLSPIGGELVAYNQPLSIKWDAKNLNQISVSLILNDKVLGSIASPSATLGEITVKPSDYILPTFVTPDNTFKIKISSSGSDGSTLSDLSRGPFAITTTDSLARDSFKAAIFARRGGDGNEDGKIDLFDASILLSNYGIKENPGLGVDLNGDQAVNDVDFFLLRNEMIQRGLIK